MRIYNIYSLGDNDIKSIYAYLKQWRFSLFFRLVTNQTSVADIIHKTYEYLDLKEPKIIFSKGVADAIDLIKQDLLVNIDDVVGCEDYQQLAMNLYFLVFGKNAEKYNLSSFQEKGAAEILAREADFFEYVCYGIYEHLHDIANYSNPKSFSKNNCTDEF